MFCNYRIVLATLKLKKFYWYNQFAIPIDKYCKFIVISRFLHRHNKINTYYITLGWPYDILITNFLQIAIAKRMFWHKQLIDLSATLKM